MEHECRGMERNPSKTGPSLYDFTRTTARKRTKRDAYPLGVDDIDDRAQFALIGSIRHQSNATDLNETRMRLKQNAFDILPFQEKFYWSATSNAGT